MPGAAQIFRVTLPTVDDLMEMVTVDVVATTAARAVAKACKEEYLGCATKVTHVGDNGRFAVKVYGAGHWCGEWKAVA
jgi:hypothetical protein